MGVVSKVTGVGAGCWPPSPLPRDQGGCTGSPCAPSSFLLPLPHHPRTVRHKVWSLLLLNLPAVIPFSPSLSHHPHLPFCRAPRALPSSTRSPAPGFHNHKVHPPLLQALPCLPLASGSPYLSTSFGAFP